MKNAARRIIEVTQGNLNTFVIVVALETWSDPGAPLARRVVAIEGYDLSVSYPDANYPSVSFKDHDGETWTMVDSDISCGPSRARLRGTALRVYPGIQERKR